MKRLLLTGAAGRIGTAFRQLTAQQYAFRLVDRPGIAIADADPHEVVVADLVIRAASDLFNALGASGVGESKALDRHWRNARTAATHNPLIYKAKVIGDWVINGTEPPYVWQIGGSPAAK